MKKQKETKKENQKSETIMNVLSKKRGFSLTGNPDGPTGFRETLLIQNTIKGPPGRSRSPGMNKIQPRTFPNNYLLIKHLKHVFTTIK